MKSQDCSPVELDKLLGTKLNYLHVLFLLRQALRRRTSDWDPELNSVAGQMLSLVVEALMLREGLVNSGTSLVWKVCRLARHFEDHVLTLDACRWYIMDLLPRV